MYQSDSEFDSYWKLMSHLQFLEGDGGAEAALVSYIIIWGNMIFELHSTDFMLVLVNSAHCFG